LTDGWLDRSELRIGLGCMRLSTDKVRDDDRAIAAIGAAVEAGITVFDTARSYGDNEQLVARALRLARATDRARVVTKGGMTRAGGAWVPDGRAKAIRADCETSLDALGSVGIDLYLLHVPDPRTPWRTSVRALARLVDEGLVRRVGVANVNRHQLDEALELAPIAAVQVALSVFDDSAVRGGVVERCEDAGVAVIAHSPLGGPRRAGRVHRRPDLLELAEQHGATPAEAALAWLLELSPAIVPIPGARRPETARSAARAADVRLEPRRKAAPAARVRVDGDLVLVMGIPGAGKTRIAEAYAERGYLRLNRDERGGTLRGIADALEEELASGVRRVVLDNTYLSRASRSYVVEAAGRHGVAVRCVWLDTPLAQAQINLVERLLELFGSLPTPQELKELAKREPGVHVPTTQMRALRELEPPSTDEGLTSVEHVAFERTPPASPGRVGVFVGAAALQQPGWERAIEQADPSAPHLLFDWRPDADAAALDHAARLLAAAVSGPVESALCPHAAGPPRCWCRPPLPGLPLAFAHTHCVDVSRSILVGTSPAHRTLAKALGTRFVQA
jgi:aryl-alcohol dehydrogenase-like predicted oxidoreductase